MSSQLFLFLLILTLWSPMTAEEPKRVLILNPYSRNVEPFSSVVSGFRATLAREYGQPLDIQEIPLDLARTGGAGDEEPLVGFIEDRVRREPVDLVVPIGTAGVQFVERHGERLFAGTPVLAVAAERRALDADFPNGNATLVSQQANLTGFVEDILQLKPDTTQIAVVLGSSPLEKFWGAECRREFKAFEGRVDFLWLDDLTFDATIDRCAGLPPGSFILHILFLVDTDGISIETNAALKRLRESANAPVFACFESELGMGSVGGRLMQNTSMGIRGAKIAIEILRGRPAGEIPPVRLETPPPTYDWRELRRWNIPESRLPEGSVVLFREPRFWDRYRWPVIGVVSFGLIESVLIMGLLVNRRRRIRGEQEATLVADISSKFINLPASDVDQEIIDAQSRLCGFLDLDAIVLWQTSGEHSEDYLATHACQLQGGAMPSPPFRQEDFPWVRGEMAAGRIVVLARLEDMPDEAAKDKESARGFGIRSSLTIPLSVGGGLSIGVLAFNMMRSERAWPQALVNRLQLVAQIFANALARKRAELALRESELRLSLATDSSGAGLWVLELGSGEFWANENARGMFGYTADERIDMESFQTSVFLEDWPKVTDCIENSVRTGAPVDVEYRIKLPDATEKWIVSRGRPFFHADGEPQRLLGLSMDITERKRSENRAHQLSLAVEQSPVLVIITDLEGKIVYVNRKFSEVTGYAPEEIIGRNPRFLKSGNHPASTYREMWDSLTQGKAWQGEFHNRKKSGDLYWEQAVISPLFDDQGKVTHYVGVKEDITDRKHAEAAVRAAEKEAEELRDNLTHLSRVNTLGALSGSLAHELNQPLGIILSNAEAAQELLLQDPPDVEEVQAILADIIAADRRAGEVIVRLRALLKRGEVALNPLPLNQVIEEVLHLLRADLIARGVTLDCDLDPCLPQVVGDRVQLQQLVLNLILNAADAMDANPPDERRIHLRTVLRDGRVRASVRDEGAGLTTAPDRLFQPFYTTKSKGLGLGLSICWSIVAAHHGQLWAEPHPERGAVFLFELPVEGSLEKT